MSQQVGVVRSATCVRDLCDKFEPCELISLRKLLKRVPDKRDLIMKYIREGVFCVQPVGWEEEQRCETLEGAIRVAKRSKSWLYGHLIFNSSRNCNPEMGDSSTGCLIISCTNIYRNQERSRKVYSLSDEDIIEMLS